MDLSIIGQVSSRRLQGSSTAKAGTPNDDRTDPILFAKDCCCCSNINIDTNVFMLGSPFFILLTLFIKAWSVGIFLPWLAPKQIRHHDDHWLAFKGNLFRQHFGILRVGSVDITEQQDSLNFLCRQLCSRHGVFAPIGKVSMQNIVKDSILISLIQPRRVFQFDGSFIGLFSSHLNFLESFFRVCSPIGALQEWFESVPTGHHIGLDHGSVGSPVFDNCARECIHYWTSSFKIFHNPGVGTPHFGIGRLGITVRFLFYFFFLAGNGRLYRFSQIVVI
mmetsp:Transcript_43990/g.106086  ORF Transcript_43990/g.106086 Transcript_43990/m.106086 type:complete len:277 (+) Transcript_43990:829-1659(+)